MTSRLFLVRGSWQLVILLVAFAAFGERLPGEQRDEEGFSRQVARLVRHLNHDRAAERDAAEAELLKLAGDTLVQNDRLLALLPEVTDQMPPSIRDRLTRIRQQIESRTAKTSVAETTVTLASREMPLTEILAAIEDQTGNEFVDFRAEFNQQVTDPKLTFELQDESFWPAVDQILDQASLGVYNFAGEDSLALVAAEAGAAPRRGTASYSGPFRFEVLEVQAQRNLRQPEQQSLRLQLEIAWEPRLRPIALSQRLSDLSATGDSGEQLETSSQRPVLDVEVQGGNQATELILPFTLPSRDVTEITSLKGKLQALVPGRIVTFRFDNLADAAGRRQRRAGVQVVLDGVRRNNVIWEVHMRLRLEEHQDALASHRTWPLQNLCYMESADGEIIDHIGLETTRQTESEIGLAYLFDLPDGIDQVTWVYETPAAILLVPVEYELREIPLP